MTPQRLAVVAAAIVIFLALSYVHGLLGALFGVAAIAAGIWWLLGKASAERDDVEGAGPRRSWLNPW